ncbi:MAG: molybdopterin molybdotransferase MoeA [Gammaproteobacteria bacterium]|nr:molybdopterin molybdotransferase MoeA [Gammaproteobacteria bacterium]MDP6616625.1 molybdopterin molybdotransferase MoeA [Gammaproteobacteria bacterium]MDP6694822.1 molybdopterin molybdotransferase MoeA [Gammaproteobacteria bacterium]
MRNERPVMLKYAQALKIIADHTGPLPTIELAPADAVGHVSAVKLESAMAVPPFDNSAMDGYAVRAADTGDASDTNPLVLTVTGVVTAGEKTGSAQAEAGTAWEIMTGAALPPGYDGVIPVEQVQVQRDSDGMPVSIELTQSVASGRNLRRTGEDFAQGSLLLDAGQVIGANQVMGLAATGTTSISVRCLPRIAAVTTGNELGDEQSELQPGMIHDANGPYLQTALDEYGAKNAGVFRTGDSADELIERIESLQPDVDMIVTTGGVSAGRMDFVPAALEQMGADILFHRVAIRPGKPLLFALLPDGTRVFGLPGNPIAVAVGLRFFVVPALRTMLGLPDERYLSAKLTEPMRKKPGLRFFGKASAGTDDSGNLVARVLPGQESFKISPLMQSNCWVIAPEEADEIPEGTAVRVAPTKPGTLI